MSETKNKGGRPPADTEPLTVRMPRADLTRIDQWRAGERPIPSRPEAIRYMVHEWLIANGIIPIEPEPPEGED